MCQKAVTASDGNGRLILLLLGLSSARTGRSTVISLKLVFHLSLSSCPRRCGLVDSDNDILLPSKIWARRRRQRRVVFSVYRSQFLRHGQAAARRTTAGS